MTYLRSFEPLVLVFQPVHGNVKVVQIPVSEQLVVDEIELPSGMCKRIAIAFSREIHPSSVSDTTVRVHLLWMSELVTFEIQVSLTSQ